MRLAIKSMLLSYGALTSVQSAMAEASEWVQGILAEVKAENEARHGQHGIVDRDHRSPAARVARQYWHTRTRGCCHAVPGRHASRSSKSRRRSLPASRRRGDRKDRRGPYVEVRPASASLAVHLDENVWPEPKLHRSLHDTLASLVRLESRSG
jgi:hypothetical protein